MSDVRERGTNTSEVTAAEGRGSGTIRCRFCSSELSHTVVDLGMSPLCESYVSEDQLNEEERFYPLHAFVCDACYLVQLDSYVSREHIFTEYAYFSSYSKSWLDHAQRYVDKMISTLRLDGKSKVVEVASNDGYLLQYFAEAGIPCLGIEPAANVAKVAIEKGIETEITFLDETSAVRLSNAGVKADLLIGNNVLAQVPNLNSFVKGLKILLATDGVLTLEFPHVLQLIDGNQFDTIYHEHFSYFSLSTVQRILSAQGLKTFDVEELDTHGGSLRVYAAHTDDATKHVTNQVTALLEREDEEGLNGLDRYGHFRSQVERTKWNLLRFLIDARLAGKTVVGYGAPGKGNTLLNYCGIRTDFLDFTVDRNPYKQGMYLPGTRIPIRHPDAILEHKPDYVLILPWNFKDEIMEQMSAIQEWGGKFVVPIPEVAVYP